MWSIEGAVAAHTPIGMEVPRVRPRSLVAVPRRSRRHQARVGAAMSDRSFASHSSRSTRRILALLVSLLLTAGCGGDVKSLEKRADALVVRNLAAQAIDAVRAELAKSPRDPRLLALLGRVKLATGDIAGADSAFGQACALDTSYFANYVSTFIAQGTTWVESSRWDLADRAFSSALEHDASASDRIATGLVAAGSRLLPSLPADADRAFASAFHFDTTTRVRIARAYLDFAGGRLVDRPRDASSDLERALAWDGALAGEIGTVVGAAAARGDSTIHALMPLIGRLGARGRSTFIRQVSGRRYSTSVTVAGHDGWMRSPFEVAIGDTVVLDPHGVVRAEAGRDGWVSDPCGPAGWPTKSMAWWEGEAGRMLAAGFPRMALIARVGGGAPFAVPGRRVWIADTSGPLALAINDVSQRAFQGAGSFTVQLEGPLSAYFPADAGSPAAEGK